MVAAAGEGLFAKINLPSDTVVAIYAGQLVDQDIVDARDWALNSNTLTYDEDDELSVDVPAPYDSTTQYCASLGHKVNSTFSRAAINCVYSTCYHPVFGVVRCIQTVKDVSEGDELYVCYGFELGTVNNDRLSDWYRQLSELDIASDSDTDSEAELSDSDTADSVVDAGAVAMDCPQWYADMFEKYMQTLQLRIDQHKLSDGFRQRKPSADSG